MQPPPPLRQSRETSRLVADRAAEAGAEIEMPVAEMFWEERYGIVRDPFGHRWALCARRELTPDDVACRIRRDLVFRQSHVE